MLLENDETVDQTINQSIDIDGSDVKKRLLKRSVSNDPTYDYGEEDKVEDFEDVNNTNDNLPEGSADFEDNYPDHLDIDEPMNSPTKGLNGGQTSSELRKIILGSQRVLLNVVDLDQLLSDKKMYSQFVYMYYGCLRGNIFVTYNVIIRKRISPFICAMDSQNALMAAIDGQSLDSVTMLLNKDYVYPADSGKIIQ